MLTADITRIAAFRKPSRTLTGGVYVYTDSSITGYLRSTDVLVNYTIERTVPNGKFFGYAVSQKLTLEVLGEYSIAKGTRIQPYIYVEGYSPTLPYFYVDEVLVNDTKSMTTITAYDILYSANRKTINEVSFEYPITLGSLATTIATYLGANLNTVQFGDTNITIEKANFNGSESLFSVLTALAEATGTICYCRSADNLIFRDFTSTKSDGLSTEDYFEFATKDAITLTKVISATELGDNVYNGTDGYTQVIHNNPFIDIQEDTVRTAMIDALAAKVVGKTMIPYTLSHRGNGYWEIGDRIDIKTLGGETKSIHFLNDTFTYNGGLSSSSFWEVGEVEETPDANPSTLSDAIKQTFAKVDKANSTIEMLVSDVADNKGNITNLKLTVDGINASVTSIEEATTDAIEGVQGSIDTLTRTVETKMTSEEVSIAIRTELANGVDKVETSEKGFTFNDDGLTVSDSQSEMKTTITEDGMTVYRNGDEVLVADNEGVKAEDLHATSFLIIGTNSRFEDYMNKTRTGCFWIGGNS